MNENPGQNKSRGISWRSLFTIIGIGLFISHSISFVWNTIRQRARLSGQLNTGRALYMALRNHAEDLNHGGQFPRYQAGSDTALLDNSNEAFEVLLGQQIEDKRVFFDQDSAWCKADASAPSRTVGAGECAWAYVRGLEVSSNPEWPLLANAFAPGTTTYVANRKKKGGDYRGKKAVVVSVSGVAEIVETTKSGDRYFVPRKDKAGANAFEKDGEWLAGEKVKVLEPK